jgi:hypothetical protein
MPKEQEPKKPAKPKSKSQQKRLASQEPKKPKNKGGRPSKYNEKLAEELCIAIATTPKGLHHICNSRDDFPTPSTVLLWRLKHDEFSAKYARAKQMQIEAFVNDIIEISDDNSRDVTEDKDGNDKPNHEFMQRSRLRVDSRKWLASKLMPKLYGDRIAVETEDGNQNELKEQLKELQAKLNKENEKDY